MKQPLTIPACVCSGTKKEHSSYCIGRTGRRDVRESVPTGRASQCYPGKGKCVHVCVRMCICVYPSVSVYISLCVVCVCAGVCVYVCTSVSVCVDV